MKEIDLVIDEIEKNEMLDRWISFNKLANESLLEKISASQIYRGFEFLANLTALFHLLGEEAHRELFLMEKWCLFILIILHYIYWRDADTVNL